MTDHPPTEMSADPTLNTWRWYKCRLVKGGPWVPCELRRFELFDRDGALTGDALYGAWVDDVAVDPFNPPSWPRWYSIPLAEWTNMMRLREWAVTYAPDHPSANPRRPVDLATMPPV